MKNVIDDARIQQREEQESPVNEAAAPPDEDGADDYQSPESRSGDAEGPELDLVSGEAGLQAEQIQPASRMWRYASMLKNKRYRRSWAKIWYFFIRQTSPIHRQDAKERYWILWRELEDAMYSKAMELNFSSFMGFQNKSPEDVEKVFSAFLGYLKDHPDNSEAVKSFSRLLLYARILSWQPLGLLNKAEALNMMWRDITFVRSRLLLDTDITPDERLPAHLEYCRLECSRICSVKEAGLEEMCHNTAIELIGSDEPNASTGGPRGNNNQKARKALVTILAKLNHIRLHDINAQLRIKKIYNVAFVLLLLLSVLLLHLNERLTDQFVPYWVAYNQFMATIDWTAPLTWLSAPMDFAIFMIQNNLLFYIFFAGLMGGVFSTVMKLRSKEVNVGDVYLRSYLLTKPIVGALSATILFILIKSNIVALNLGQIQVIDKLSDNASMFGPLGFSFGFIMGFSERIILPTVNTETSK